MTEVWGSFQDSRDVRGGSDIDNEEHKNARDKGPHIGEDKPGNDDTVEDFIGAKESNNAGLIDTDEVTKLCVTILSSCSCFDCRPRTDEFGNVSRRFDGRDWVWISCAEQGGEV